MDTSFCETHSHQPPIAYLDSICHQEEHGERPEAGDGVQYAAAVSQALRQKRASMSGAGVAAASWRKVARSLASSTGAGAGMLRDTDLRSRPPPAASKASGRGSPGCRPPAPHVYYLRLGALPAQGRRCRMRVHTNWP